MRSKNQKLKLLYLAKIMREKTDETHMLTLKEIIKELEKYDIGADRKTLYDDMAVLSDFGISIEKKKDGYMTYYYCNSADFELAELHMIIDAIVSSQFITIKKSKNLIKKLEGTVSKYNAKLLERDILVSGRVKNMNESIFYTIDAIQEAISKNLRISFQYFYWDNNGKKQLKHNGKIYDVSPWALVWNNDKYYMLAYDDEEKKLKHYRVDKMLKTSVGKAKRKGIESFRKTDKTEYSKMHFGMFGGKKENVTLICDNEIANSIIDRFGKEIPLQQIDENHFKTVVCVYVSKKFLSWIIAFEGKAIIKGPESVKEEMRELLMENMRKYEEK